MLWVSLLVVVMLGVPACCLLPSDPDLLLEESEPTPVAGAELLFAMRRRAR
jgi:hypothetical protein